MSFVSTIEHVNVDTYTDVETYYDYDIVLYNSGSSPPQEIYFVSISGGLQPPCGFGEGHIGQLDTSGFASNAYWKRFGDTGWAFSDVWTPSYSTNVESQQNNREFNFGDGYKQSSEKGLIFSNQKIQSYFKGITDQESASLLAFLIWCGSNTPIYCKLSNLYKKRKFTVESFKHSYNSYDSHDINILFKETEK